jgi:protein TonB
MKTLRFSILTSLALAAGAPVRAQSPSAAPQARPLQDSISSSNRARVELCRKKGHVPLEPKESQPQPADGRDGTVTRPTPIYQVPPRFKGSRGTVVVEALIDEDGCVRQTRIVESKTTDRSLDAAAVKAVEQWVFLPATKDGRPVRVYYDMTFNMSTTY